MLDRQTAEKMAERYRRGQYINLQAFMQVDSHAQKKKSFTDIITVTLQSPLVILAAVQSNDMCKISQDRCKQ